MMMKIKNALISVTNKQLISDLANELKQLGIQIYSTKGTSKFLKEQSIDAHLIEEYINFPEILDGRVKTLHPKIFGGILARKELDTHLKQMQEHNIASFDIVCVDLYAVEKAINDNSNLDNVIENIDIGGISLIRAAAKSFKNVIILTDSNDFKNIINEIKQTGDVNFKTRKKLAAKAFKLSSYYDNIISAYLFDSENDNSLKLNPIMDLKYGENPHQNAGYFSVDSKKTYIKQAVKGDISYNNLLDLDGAVDLCFGLKKMGYPHVAVIVKHGSPSGIGISNKNIDNAFIKAWDCDPRSSFGGVLVLSDNNINDSFLNLLSGKFIEVVSASNFTEDFIEKAESRKKLKIISLNQIDTILEQNVYQYRSSCGGILKQGRDVWWNFNIDNFELMSSRVPNKQELEAVRLAWATVSVTKSNSIVIASENKILGIGGGCVSRIDSSKMAVQKTNEYISSLENNKESCRVMASDGFFPFADSIEFAAQSGITAVVEPGGSIRDTEVIEACNKHNMALLFTKIRHFRH